MKNYLVEFIGTLLFVTTIGMVVVTPGVGPLAPLAIASALMVVVYAGGHISGGHYNPAVTLGVFLRGKCEAKDVAPYMAAQVLGAVVAGFIVMYLADDAMEGVKAMEPDVGRALLSEFLFTFALVYVVLNTATAKATEGNSFYGLAIGFTVLIGAYAVGGISGGAFNPAVAVGITVMGLSAWANIWIFLAANLLGGVVAAYTFKFVAGDD